MTRRYGLVGTGYWAREVHAPALAGRDDGELVGVWGRDPDKAGRLADAHGARAFADPAELFDAVDVVGFAVPPDVQAPLATRAARAGCDLLLEKPVALDVAAADDLVAAATEHRVASVVFFTLRFVPAVADWIARLSAAGPWLGGRATWMGSLDEPDSPFGGSPWRRREGALWDVGPHALSVLLPLLGPVTDVAAVPGSGDTVHLVLGHEAGPTSTVSLSSTVPPPAACVEAAVYGERGWERLPESPTPPLAALERALDALAAAADGGTPHPCDVAFGAEVVQVLARVGAALGDPDADA